MFKKCANCPVLIHRTGGKWEHIIPPYVFCVNGKGKATPR